MLHVLDGTQREAGGRIRDGCGEAVDADLHHSGSRCPVFHWMTHLRFCCMFVTWETFLSQRPALRCAAFDGIRSVCSTFFIFVSACFRRRRFMLARPLEEVH